MDISVFLLIYALFCFLCIHKILLLRDLERCKNKSGL